MTRTEARTAEAASALHLISGGLAAENIQTIDKVKHAVAVHAVIFVYRAAACSQRTADVTLLLQNVVHLEADGGIPFQESLRQLCIPDKLVTVHTAVRISSTALVGDVSREAHAPRHTNGGVGTVRKIIRLLVVVRIQLVALDGVVKSAVQPELQPIVAISTVQTLVQRKFRGGIFLFDGFRTLAGGLIAYIVIIADVREGAYGKLLVFKAVLMPNTPKAFQFPLMFFEVFVHPPVCSLYTRLLLTAFCVALKLACVKMPRWCSML